MAEVAKGTSLVPNPSINGRSCTPEKRRVFFAQVAWRWSQELAECLTPGEGSELCGHLTHHVDGKETPPERLELPTC